MVGKMIDTKHFKDMLKERNIPLDMVNTTIALPDRIEEKDDGTIHYLKYFDNQMRRWLRVVVNMKSQPPRRITAFFDRRLRKK